MRMQEKIQQLIQMHEEKRLELEKRKWEREAIQKRIESLDEIIQQNETSLEIENKTKLLLQKVSIEARDRAKDVMEKAVTHALQYIFGSDFSFEIKLKETKNRVEAEFYVLNNIGGQVIRSSPEEACGGGVVDIISIALRMALLHLYQNPKINGPVILDEPGKHVSADYTIKLAEFLKHLSSMFQRQIILSTHQMDLAHIADQTYTVDIKNGASTVKTE